MKSTHGDAFNQTLIDSALAKPRTKESYGFAKAKRFSQISAIVDGVTIAMLNCGT